MGDPGIKEAHEKKWTEAAQRCFTQVRDKLLAEASQQIELLINNTNMRLNQMYSDSSTDSKAIIAEFSQFLQQYSKMPGGAAKEKRLMEFLQSTLQVNTSSEHLDAVGLWHKLQTVKICSHSC